MTPMKYYFFAAILFWYYGVSGQTQFQKTAGSNVNDRGYQIASLSDGSILATGTTEGVSGNAWDSYLVNFNRFGEVVWALTYGDAGDDVSWDLIVTPNDDVVGVGTSTSLGTPYSAATITKITSVGSISWLTGVYSTTANVDFYRVLETTTGEYLATGLVGTSSNQDDILLCKFSANGNLLWSRAIGTGQADEAMGMIETSQGHYLLAGLTNDKNGNGGSDFAAVKLDTAGNVIWKKNYGGSSSERMNSVLEINNTYYFCGWSSSAGQGQSDIILLNTDTAGNINWTKAYGTIEDDCAFNLLFNSSDSTITLAGYTDYSVAASNRNTLLMKVDLSGNLIWAKSYGSGGMDGHWPTGMTQNDDEGYYLLGVSNSFSGGDDDLYLIKTDGAGDAGCNQKDPQFKEMTVSGWAGTNFGTAYTIGLSGINVPITGNNWVLVAITQCCELFADAGQDSTLCPADTVTIKATPISGYSYQWNLGGSVVATDSSHDVIYGQAGTYELEVTAPGSACGFSFDSVTLIDDVQPALGFNNSYSFCTGDSVELFTTATFDSLNWYSAVQNTQVAQGNSYVANISDTLTLKSLSQNQCLFTDEIVIKAFPLPNTPTVTVNGAQLTSTAANSYQWFFEGDTVQDASQSNYIAKNEGYYYVVVTNTFGCSARSDSVMVKFGGLGNDGLEGISVYPNPSNGIVTLSGMENLEMADVEVFDLSGKHVYENMRLFNGKSVERLNLSYLENGTYRLKITTESGAAYYQVVIVK